MTCTKTVSKLSFNSDYEDVLSGIEKSIKKNSSTVFCAYDGTPLITRYSHNIVRMLPSDTREQNIFKQIIIEHMMLSETTAATSSSYFLKYLIFLHKKFKNENSVNKSKDQSRNICNKFKRSINSLLRNPTHNDLEEFLKKNFDEIYQSSTLEVLKSAGVNGKIQIKTKDIDQILIDVEEGYSFDVIPDENLLYLSKGKYEREKVKCFVIDGIIEKVSEIDKILNYGADTKNPIAIFCRGYTEEVLSTVMTNNTRGTLDVFLITSQIETNSINDLTDICYCSGSKYISVYGGDMISSIDPYEEDNLVDKITIVDKKVTIVNHSTRKIVQRHLSKLISEAQENTELEYYKNRIKNLSAKTVTLFIPNNCEQENVFKISDFDSALRASKSVISRGIVKIDDLMKADNMDKEFLEYFDENREEIYPAESIFIATDLATRCFNIIKNVDKMIIIDD